MFFSLRRKQASQKHFHFHIVKFIITIQRFLQWSQVVIITVRVVNSLWKILSVQFIQCFLGRLCGVRTCVIVKQNHISD
jgi:hypothetical protein